MRARYSQVLCVLLSLDGGGFLLASVGPGTVGSGNHTELFTAE